MSLSPLFSVHQPCDTALMWAKERLSQTGLRPIQTFDLHTARAGLHGCSCPHHGMDECDCQMVVVLVYGDSEQPSTLILHGSDGRTKFTETELTYSGIRFRRGQTSFGRIGIITLGVTARKNYYYMEKRCSGM